MNTKIIIILLAAIVVVGVAGIAVFKYGGNKTSNQPSPTESSQKEAAVSSAANNAPRNRVINTPVTYSDKGFDVDSMAISKGQSVVVINKTKSLLTLEITTSPAGSLLIQPGQTGVTLPFGTTGIYEVKDSKKNILQVTVKE